MPTYVCNSVHTFPMLHTGSIATGLISDLLGARAISCVLMTYLAVPTVSRIVVCSQNMYMCDVWHMCMTLQLFLYRFTGLESYAYTIGEH